MALEFFRVDSQLDRPPLFLLLLFSVLHELLMIIITVPDHLTFTRESGTSPFFFFPKKKSKFNSINFSTLKQLRNFSFPRPHPQKYWKPHIHRVNLFRSSQVIPNCVPFFLQRIEIESEGTCSSQANKPLKLYLWVLEFFEFL